uniref:UPAR/Ly6 domain-containing protein n=1 Tax=Panagrolaimus davidi TaxID=227884 RepID=A0A914QEH5_9BILA
MKTFFFLLIFVAYFNVVKSINCVSSENGVIKNENLSCPLIDSYCATVTLKHNDTASGLVYINKRQGCGNEVRWTAHGTKYKCDYVGNSKYSELKDHNIELASASCCDTDLCNGDAPKIVVDAPKAVYNSATKSYSLVGFFIFLVSVPFFLA